MGRRANGVLTYLYASSRVTAFCPFAVQARLPPFHASSLDSEHSINALEPRFRIEGKSDDNSAVLQDLAVRSAECESLRRALDDKDQAFAIASGVLETNQNDLLLKISDLVTALNEAQRVMTMAESKLDETKAELTGAQSRIKDLEKSLNAKDAELDELRNTGGGGLVAKKINELDEIPNLHDWCLDNDGAIIGKVSNHPEIDDGTTILTSTLEDTSVAEENGIVTTSTGSRYRLGSLLDNEDTKIPGGNVVGDGKYLLVGKPKISAAGRSQIWSAFPADAGGEMEGETAPLVVKVSSNRLAMEREWANYQRTVNISRGLIVSPVEFLSKAGSSASLAQKCAIVMERGVLGDVKDFLARRGGRGLKGPALRNMCKTAAQCTQIMHSSKLVWTDLKVENFVVVKDLDGSISIKAIDLESAIKRGGMPVDFSPESCPPEFAAAFLSGEGQSFSLEYSYDIWSLGTFLYELVTGRGPFEGMSPSEITHQLPNFQPDVDDAGIDDPDLRNLLSQCLELDPHQRPTIADVLNHSYFQ